MSTAGVTSTRRHLLQLAIHFSSFHSKLLNFKATSSLVNQSFCFGKTSFEVFASANGIVGVTESHWNYDDLNVVDVDDELLRRLLNEVTREKELLAVQCEKWRLMYEDAKLKLDSALEVQDQEALKRASFVTVKKRTAARRCVSQFIRRRKARRC
jgi:hypothetical protein